MKYNKILLSILVFILLSSCNSQETKKLSQFYKKDITNIDKITILDGRTGSQKTITKRERIDGFLSLIKDIEFIPDKNQEKKKGFIFSITLFEGKNAFTFTPNEVNEHYYSTNPDIFPIVDSFYESLDE